MPPQTPLPLQASFVVHALLSLQSVPAGFGNAAWHTPAKQVSANEQAVAGAHCTPVPAQVPLVQTSFEVQLLPSSQVDPFGLIGLLHTPPLQVPAKWH